MPLPHIFVITSFPCILLVSSLNTTLIKYMEINLRKMNSGHTDDVTLRLLGNKNTPLQHLLLLGTVCLTFFWRTQWKMNINIPCRELNMVKRYAMMTVLSLIYMSPNAQVSPNRHSRAMAPITQDLLQKTRKRKEERVWFFIYKRRHMSTGRKTLPMVLAKSKESIKMYCREFCLQAGYSLQIFKLEEIYRNGSVMSIDIYHNQSIFVTTMFLFSPHPLPF